MRTNSLRPASGGIAGGLERAMKFDGRDLLRKSAPWCGVKKEALTSHEPAMDLQLHQRQKEGIWILDLRGHLIIGDSEAILRGAIVGLAGARAVNVILNLAGVTEIDDDGLGALVFCYARIGMSGGALKLLNLSPLHLSLMVLTKLEAEFEVFTDEQDAVDSFFPDRAPRHYDILEWIQEQEKRPAPDLPK
jgi:anti-sigma B factor antagonist